MAIRTKTIEYAWNTDTSSVMTTDVPYTSSNISVYFPETGSARSFQSVWLELHIRDSSALTSGRGSIQTRTFSMVIDGTSTAVHNFDAETSLVDTGEQVAYLFTCDFTKEFQAITGSATGSILAYSFQYTSATADPGFRNLTGKMYLTYEYDDSLHQRVKTITIPFDKDGPAEQTLTEIPAPGYPQVPELDSFCPESNKVFRNIWFEFSGNEYAITTDDYTFTASLDDESPVGLTFSEMANSRGTSTRMCWVRDDLDTSSTHSIKLSCPNQTYGFKPTSAYMKATYEYDHNNSTTILNSLIIPFLCSSPNFLPDINSAWGVFSDDIFIEEPEPIDMKQSGVFFIYGFTSTGPKPAFQVNTGSIISNVDAVIAQTQSPPYWTHITRTDYSGSYSDSRIPMKRGLNPINVKFTNSTGVSPHRLGNVCGYYFLNYHSGKHADGDGAHNHTIRRMIIDWTDYSTAGYTFALFPYTSSLPETNFFVNSFGAVDIIIDNSARLVIPVYAPALEIGRDFYDISFATASSLTMDISQPMYGLGTERHWGEMVWADQFRRIRRYPQKLPDPLRGIGICDFQLQHTMSYRDGTFNQFIDMVTYHTITYSVTGSLSGSYTGDGSGVTVGLFRSDNKDLLTTGSTGVGGTYSFTWYDNTIPVFVEAMETSASKAGRSLDGYAQ